MRGKIGAMAALVFLGCVWAMPAYGAEGDTYVAGTYLNLSLIHISEPHETSV